MRYAIGASVLLSSLWLTACSSFGVSEDPPKQEPAYVAELKPKLEALLGETLATASVVVIVSPELGDWRMTFGSRSRGGAEGVTLNDHVRVGSNTKTWTGTLILQLAEEGKLSVDDPVSKFRSDVPNGEKITLGQLLDMRSGVFNYTETLELNRALDESPARVWPPDELIAMGVSKPPYFEPGQGWHYSNTNTVLLGAIVEKVTGRLLEDEMKTRIFDKLGLKETLFPARTSNAIPAPHPRGYQFGTNVETLDTQVLPADKQAAAKAGTYVPIDFTDTNPSWGWAAGAGVSTAPDLATYVKALAGGGLLGAEMQKKRLESVKPTADTPGAVGYGWGIAQFGPMLGHTGELPGFNTFMGHDPSRNVTVIVWTSLAAAPDGRAPAVEMAKAIITQLYAKPSSVDSPSNPGTGE